MPIHGERLFTFAMMADSHIKPEQGVHSSPWATNQLARPRIEYVVQRINAFAPDFVIHLGDFVHPVPTLPSYDVAADAVTGILSKLNAPLHTIPGNHDIGDKHLAWMPASLVSEETIARYERHFGQTFSSFQHHDCRFILLNASVLNSGLPLEREQQEWLEQELTALQGARTFLCLHYPLYLTDPDEDEHYDNVAEPARSWLLSRIENSQIEAVFAGHVHNLFYNRYGDTELYVLPSVTSVRQDYSELFRIGPADEYGRNDTGKLGFFVVHVYEHGHRAEFVHTDGAIMGAGIVPAVQIRAVHPKEGRANPVGVELRHPWAEITALPFNYLLDEFSRKTVRNDYPVVALWDLGVRKLRVPISDVMNPRTRERMHVLKAVGHEFTVFSYGIPDQRIMDVLTEQQDLVDVWQVVVPWEQRQDLVGALASRRSRIASRIHLSCVETSAQKEDADAPYSDALNRGYYFTRHGFRLDQYDPLAAFLEQPGVRDVVDGIVVRIGPGDAPWAALQKVDHLACSLGIEASIMLQLAADNPAEANQDDRVVAYWVAETVAAAHAVGRVDVFLDTFADIDRGYFVRNGLVDRRYNLRMAGQVYMHLHSVLSTHVGDWTMGHAQTMAGGQTYSLSAARDRAWLVLPDPLGDGARLEQLPVDTVNTGSGAGRVIDLVSGSVRSITWRRATMGGGESVMVEPLATPTEPVLVMIEG